MTPSDTVKYEKVTVVFERPLTETDMEAFEEHAEILDSHTVEFIPDRWDLYGDVRVSHSYGTYFLLPNHCMNTKIFGPHEGGR